MKKGNDSVIPFRHGHLRRTDLLLAPDSSRGRRLRKCCLRDIEGGLRNTGFGFEKERAEIQPILEPIQSFASLHQEAEKIL